MLNLVYLILLADINLLFGVLALFLIPYYVNLSAIRFCATPAALLLFSTIIFTVPISFFSGFLSLNLICIFLYFFRYSFYSNRSAVPPRVVIYVLCLLAIIQIIFPEQIIFLRDLIGDNRVEVVDYSEQLLSSIRFSGIFTNPNFFAITIILLYAIDLLVNRQKFSKVLNLTVLISMALSGSRAALACYIIISAVLFLNNQSSRSYLAIIFLSVTSAALLIIDFIDLRFLQFGDFLSNADLSLSGRTQSISMYINDLWLQGQYIQLLFGRGYADPYIYYFDGDFGNLLHLFGMSGSAIFAIFISLRYKKVKGFHILLVLLPFIFAGGIFGNLKTLFIFAFLPDLLADYNKKESESSSSNYKLVSKVSHGN